MREGRILNRLVRVSKDGWHIEADPRHAELIIQELGLTGTKGLSTPGVDDPENEDENELGGDELSKYRSLAARANYLSMDRPDLQFAVKELCRQMARPTRGAWRKLIRVGKYLVQKPRLVLDFHWQEIQDTMTVFSDANWAGCHRTRKSTSGGVIKIGEHLIRSWSKTQATVALSSAESEFYATLKACQEALGMSALAEELNMKYGIRVLVDASAALGVAQRKGLGKIRHLHTGSLWIQEQELKQRIKLLKVNGSKNTSDMMTKNLARELMERHVEGCGARFMEGRADMAVHLHLIMKEMRQLQAELKVIRGRQVRRQEQVVDNSVVQNNDIDLMMMENEKTDEEVIRHGIEKWERRLCREEGIMLKKIKEALHDDGRK